MSSQLQLWPKLRPPDRLTWSVSRDKRLRDCARKYYFYHFGSKGGKAAPPDTLARQLYVLKHLRNRFMWVGEVVHELLEHTLIGWTRGQQVHPDNVVERGLRRMRAAYAASLQGLYRDRPSQTMGLIEHEYNEPVTRQNWQELRDRMERCIRQFFEQPLAAGLRQVPGWRWLALESLSSFSIDNATIIVKPDVAYRGEHGRVVLIDWKTGQPRAGDERLQMAVYGLFAERVWGLGEHTMQAHLMYLDSGQVCTMDVTAEQLRRMEAEISASVSRMRALATALPERRTPDPAGFAATDDLAQCRRCAFRRVCNRENC